MCNVSCVMFAAKNFTKEEIQGKRILELGSNDINGNLRPIIGMLEPAEYVGVDIHGGPGVDVVCGAEDIIDRFGKDHFDVVVSTEMLEHVRDWRTVFSNIKNVCKPGGVILLTTRSFGFNYHGFPHDFWRYELDDMRTIFSDCEVLALQADPEMPGVLIKVKKPGKFIENDLSNHTLYSIVVNKRIQDIRDSDFTNVYFIRLKLKLYFKQLRRSMRNALRK